MTLFQDCGYSGSESLSTMTSAFNLSVSYFYSLIESLSSITSFFNSHICILVLQSSFSIFFSCFSRSRFTQGGNNVLLVIYLSPPRASETEFAFTTPAFCKSQKNALIIMIAQMFRAHSGLRDAALENESDDAPTVGLQEVCDW